MTSNLGSAKIQDLTSAPYATMKEAVMQDVKQYFKPEIINRIDEIVVFHSLRKQDIEGIVNIQLSKLKDKLKKQNLAVEFDNSAISQLCEIGFDPTFGARPLKRAIQTHIEDYLADKIIMSELFPDTEYLVVYEKEEFAIHKIS